MGGFISPATLEQIRAASDIVDVVGGYIPLKRNGANFVALCPFHREKTPSFNVNPHKQIFHCFGCHKGGDVFSFVKEYENVDFPDAVRRLAERARIPIETENQPGGTETRHLKDRLFQIHEQITQRWQSALATDQAGQIARDYLARRGVSAEAVQLFRLGYAPDAWDDTVNWAKAKHFETPLMEQSGLVLRKEGSDRFYDRFRGRLIFPICDEQGRVVAFSGRILTGDEKTAKYVNSPETPIFTKGKILFGLDKSKRAILDARYAIICEGQLDLIACFMSGVKNVVAPQGTALTSDHARVLSRFTQDVVLCFDSDNAGQNASLRSWDTLMTTATQFNTRRISLRVSEGKEAAHALSLRVAILPVPHDPDSFIKTFGVPAFLQVIERSPGFFDYCLDRLCSLHDTATDRGRRAIVQGMADALHKAGAGDEVLLDTYAQKTALRLAVAADAMRHEFKKSPRASAVETDRSDESDESSEPAAPRPSQHEWWLLRVLLESNDQLEWVAEHLDLEWLPNAGAREIAARRLRMGRDWPGAAAWLSQLENPAWRSLVTEILADSRPVPDALALLQGSPTREGLVKILRDKHIERTLAALNQRLAAPDLPEAAQTEVLAETQRLRRLKKEPLAPKSDHPF
jgi:DNA primase